MGRRASNGTKHAGTEGVDGIEIVEQLDISAELKSETGIVGARRACNKGQGADSVGDAACTSRQHVQAMSHVVQHGHQEELGEAPEGYTVCARSDAWLLGGAVGASDFANMAVRCNNFEVDGNVGTDALRFMIGMDVADFESAMMV